MPTARYEIQGQLEILEGRLTRQVWHPLFQFESETKARGALAMLIDGENIPKGAGVDEYEDFRLVELEAPRPRRRPQEPAAEPEAPNPRPRRRKAANGRTAAVPETPERPRRRKKAAR